MPKNLHPEGGATSWRHAGPGEVGLKARVLTSLIAIPLVLAVVGCTNPWPLAVVLAATFAISISEIDALFGKRSVGNVIFAFSFFVVAARSIEEGQSPSRSVLVVVVIGAAWLALWVIGWVATQRKSRSVQLAALIPWLGICLIDVQVIHSSVAGDDWLWVCPNPLLLLLLPVWAGDIAAMLGGMAFGKHLLAPKISPQKTWEGAVSNFLAATLVGWGVGAWLGYETWVGPACGAAVGVFGQLGDLFESALKRSVGKKDSGNLLPGHGGLLDRIDALLGATVPVWLILYFSGSV